MSSFKLLIGIIFFFSGAAGLVYELIWSEMLIKLLGASSLATTMILIAFMGGLATGSLLLGRLAENWSDDRIAKTFVAIELLVGCYALAFPTIVASTESAYIVMAQPIFDQLWLSTAIKLLFSLLILIIPTIAMGATLPLISRYLNRHSAELGKDVSLLYGLNTFGAIIGISVAGFFLLQTIGISGATEIAAIINFLNALSFYFLNRKIHQTYTPKATSDSLELQEPLVLNTRKTKKDKTHQNKITTTDASMRSEFTLVIFSAYALSGAAAMFYQVAWTRTLSMILGTSTYAFTIILATFLTGIALGSLVYHWMPTRFKRLHLFIALQLVVAFSVLFVTPFFDDFPLLYLGLQDTNLFSGSWEDTNYIRLIIAFIVMFVPTLAMGMLFPISCDAVKEESPNLTNVVGLTYAYNAYGAMIGAALAGLFFIPTVGLQNTILIGVFLNVVAVLLVIWLFHGFAANQKTWIALPIGLITLLWIPAIEPWSPYQISSGVYVYTPNYQRAANNYLKIATVRPDVDIINRQTIYAAAMNNYDLLYYHDGFVDSVAVMRNKDGIISLMVNGKVDASAKGEKDVSTQIMIGQLPMLFHPDPKEAFLVGYASGMTAGAILTHQVEHLDAAELSSSVVAASRLFSRFNNDPLSDPRLNLMVRDARQTLMVSNKSYDVIVAQPSNPWIKGQSSLFAYEWYKIVQKHLKQDGLLIQWLPAYNISEENLKVIINTLHQVFPNVSLWSSSTPGDVILVASINPDFKIDYQQVMQRLNEPKVAEQMKKVGLDQQQFLQTAFMMDNAEVEAYLAETPNIGINQDDLLITEYSAPKNMINRNVVKQFAEKDNMAGKTKHLKEMVINLPD